MVDATTHPAGNGARGALAYAEIPRPDPGRTVEVAPGILWARIPLPFQLDHVNVWMLEDGDGWTVVDTGIADDGARACWSELMDGSLGGHPIKRVILTHFHPDHVGCAPSLIRRHDASVWMTRPEWLTARLLAVDSGDGMTETTAGFFAAAGCSPHYLTYVRRRGASYADLVDPLPRRHQPMYDGQEIVIGERGWRVLVGAGHSPAHACLWCEAEGILIAGDQILPRISPNVGVNASAPEADPLADFLTALDRFEGFAGDPLVLPSHDAPFRGLQVRARDLARHHEERLALARDSCRQEASAYDVARVIFDRPLDDHQTGFAIAETIAHLNRLCATGQVARRTDADGLWWYRALEASRD